MNFLARALIRFYQLVLSPMLGQNKCKYHPTCSSYAMEAFTYYRFTTALMLSLWRILRCNPWSKGGDDPLPQ